MEMNNESQNVARWQPSDAEERLLKQIEKHWQSASEARHKSYRHLNDRTLERFWDDSRDHYNGYVSRPDNVEQGWKSKDFKKKTRHKVVATVAAMLSSGVGLDFSAFNRQDQMDRLLSRVLEDIYNWTLDRERYDHKELTAFVEKVVVGTVHILDEVVWDTRQVKDIVDIDFETGEVRWAEKEHVDFKGCRSEVVPNEELFPGDLWEPEVQEQPFYIRRKLVDRDVAEKSLGRWPNFRMVVAGRGEMFDSSTSLAEGEKESSDMDDNDIEVIWYWNKPEDVFCIVANGVMLTPIGYGFPYPHKNYPWAKGIFEPFGDTRFYYGDSLPNKNYDEQEVVNELWRMFIDSTKLKNRPPLFTNNAELMNTDLVVPGSITTWEKGDEVQTIPEVTQGVSPGESNVLLMAERQMDENSIDPLVSGRQAQGDPTATEVRVVAGSAQRLQGFNEQFIGDLKVQHAHLRLPNALWFLTHDDEYQRVIRNDVKINSGQTGKRSIEFVSAGTLPTPQEILKAENALERRGEPTELLFVDKDRIFDYRYHVEISASPKMARRGAARLIKAVQKYMLYLPNPMVDQKANIKKLIEAMGDDPEELISKEPMPVMPTERIPKQNQALSKQMGQLEQQMAL